MKKILSVLFLLAMSVVAMATPPHVDIAIDGTTTTTITASFSKNASCQSYYILAAESGSLDIYLAWGMTVEEMVEQWGIQYNSDATYTWTEQVPSTLYDVYALAIGNGEKVLSSVSATTQGQGGSGMSIINIEVSEISETSARVVCTPNDHTSMFFDMLITKELFDSVGVDTAIAWLCYDNPYPMYETDDWLWTDLLPNKEYYAIAMGQNGNGEWGPLAQSLFVTQGSAGVSPLPTEPQWSVSPNPASEWVDVKGLAPAERVELYNELGCKLNEWRVEGASLRFSVGPYPAGIYHLRCTDAFGQVSSRRLIVK